MASASSLVVEDVPIHLDEKNEHHNHQQQQHRRADNALQNMCGASYGDAMRCGQACPKGTDAECRTGEMCFASVDCPIPPPQPTISPKPTNAPVPTFTIGDHEKQIIGYYASWQWYDRSKLAKPSNMDFKKVTRVNYAFFQSDAEGNIWGTDEWGDPRVLFGDIDATRGKCNAGQPRCRCSWVKPQFKSCSYHNDPTGLIWLVHQARGDIYPSIGGWTLSDTFSPMANDPTSRKIFASNCRNLIVDYNFDGIDLDWEYPGYAAHNGHPYDKQNFNLLLQDIREELDKLGAENGRFYGLTAALPCGPSNIRNINIVEVSKYLTELNLMTYDFHGAWDALTGVNSALYDQAQDPKRGWSVDGCVRNWIGGGASQERINVGLGFYGRSFRTAKALGSHHGGTDDSAWAVDEGTPQYFNIMAQIDSMTIDWDEETKTPYAYFNDNKGGLVSYDDEQSICLKTEYAIKEDLNGFIIWELSGDLMEDLNTPLLDMVNRKLSESDTNCADPFGSKLAMEMEGAINLPNAATEATAEEATTEEAITMATTSSTAFSAVESASMEASPATISSVESSATVPSVSSASSAAVSPTTVSSASSGLDLYATVPVVSSASSATVSSASAGKDLYAPGQIVNGRKQVKRDTRKPKKPYRPQKDSITEL
eukprot:CAMPEP_0196153706 /NCGR_PEP_ID=MMETSP0910-20130528/37653_1 /TAXON_ID=49265 /ORGANISM="Thalassiosira rotula, Strain GSO102" /LENGTH=653 /DNA_ID=CAMNT_0041417579 /DNA_START=108 /DNA_END=2069 /DNA_ORIENTATION=+